MSVVTAPLGFGLPAAAVPIWADSPAMDRVREAARNRLPFVDVQVHDRSGEAAERSAPVLAARERLLAALTRTAPRLATERTAIAAALAAGTLRVVHLLARRA